MSLELWHTSKQSSHQSPGWHSIHSLALQEKERLFTSSTGVSPAKQCSSEWGGQHPSRHQGNVNVQIDHHLGLCLKLASHVNSVPG